jgi:predicted ATPase
LLRRLEKRLPLLTQGASDLPERQRTLRGTIAWSHDLLGPEEQVAFRRLAVFAGGCTFEAVEAVVAGDGSVDPYEALAALVRQSLLRQERAEGEPRFAMLETIREYASERLEASGEAEAIRGRHARHVLDLTGGEDAQLLYGEELHAWLDRLEPDHDNLRAALAWAVEQAGGETALRLAAALFRFWDVRGHLGEGRDWLGRALAASHDAATPLRTAALWALGSLAESQQDYDAAAHAMEEALTGWRALGDRRGVARALRGLGFVAQGRGLYGTAEDRFEESLALWRELGDERDVAIGSSSLANVAYFRNDLERATHLWADAAARFRGLGDRRSLSAVLSNLGAAAWMSGDFDRAARLHEEALALAHDLRDEVGIATGTFNLGQAVASAHDQERAAVLLEEALRRSRELGIPDMIARALYSLAETAREQGDAARAASLAGEGLATANRSGDQDMSGYFLELVAALAADDGQARRGARLLGMAIALAEAEDYEPSTPEREIHDRSRDAVRSRLTEDEAAALISEGRTMGYDAAVAEALALAAELATG